VLEDLIANPAVPSLALAMVDVDGLKAANDTHGHQAGDELLTCVAQALMRDGAVVGRYGGDEFVAILPGAERAAAEAYRERVLETLAGATLRDPDSGARIDVVASIGLAIYPEEADAVEDLIRLSDSAMYASKRKRAMEGGVLRSRRDGADPAAKIVGEIVPFLTSPGSLEEKLHLVASRLSAADDYAAVEFTLFDEADDASTDDGRIAQVLRRTHRPIIIEDVPSNLLVSAARRRAAAENGLCSALVAPMVWQGEVVGALNVASTRPFAFGPRDAQVLGAVATQVTSIVQTSAMVDELQDASNRLLQAHTETVLMLAGAAEAHDVTTGRHLQRVRALAEALALELGHDARSAKEIGLAAVLHDIGKIRVPDYVLASASQLSDDEWRLMKQHTVWGGEFLAARGGFELAAQVARCHHERWDGTGYPDGLAGDEIPEAAAITAVADSLDAMISDRPYRAGRPPEDAVREVEAWSGRQFSPTVVQALLRLWERGELQLSETQAPRRRKKAA
jgi:diguanylate cyclase (GGDEF)-like protein